MPRKLPPHRQLTLSDDKAFRALRQGRVSIHARVHSVTGGVSFWTSAPRAEGKRWRKGILIKALPPRTTRNTIEIWCEKLGCPPPWIPRVDRAEWRSAWRRRNGVSGRVPRIERERRPPRIISIESLGKRIEDIPDDRDDYEDDEDLDDEDDDDQPQHEKDYDG